MPQRFDVSNVPDLSGQVVVVTGANSGIGYEAAKVLAGQGASVLLAVRDDQKGRAAAVSIRKLHTAADVHVMQLDLADLTSIHQFAEAFYARFDRLAILINNAGVMAPPHHFTKDGFELQFGTNHLGHFALTGLLLPRLLSTGNARVVTVSSAAHRGGRMEFDNLNGNKGYARWRFYGQSKLANLLFAYELQRRATAAETSLVSVACHPGFAATNLTASGIGLGRVWLGKMAGSIGNLFAQSAAMGALPTLFAATNPDVKGGEFIGPTGSSGMRGYPGIVRSNSRSYDLDTARRLWNFSEESTGVQYTALNS